MENPFINLSKESSPEQKLPSSLREEVEHTIELRMGGFQIMVVPDQLDMRAFDAFVEGHGGCVIQARPTKFRQNEWNALSEISIAADVLSGRGPSYTGATVEGRTQEALKAVRRRSTPGPMAAYQGCPFDEALFTKLVQTPPMVLLRLELDQIDKTTLVQQVHAFFQLFQFGRDTIFTGFSETFFLIPVQKKFSKEFIDGIRSWPDLYSIRSETTRIEAET